MSRARFLTLIVSATARATDHLVTKAKPSMFRIVADAIRGTGVTLDDLKSPSRAPEVLAAKKRIASTARAAGLTVTEVARYFGRHHTTILHWEGQK